MSESMAGNTPEMYRGPETPHTELIVLWSEAILAAKGTKRPSETVKEVIHAEWDDDEHQLRCELQRFSIMRPYGGVAYLYALHLRSFIDNDFVPISYTYAQHASGVQKCDRGFVPLPVEEQLPQEQTIQMLSYLKTADILAPDDQDPRDIMANPSYLEIVYQYLLEDASFGDLVERYMELDDARLKQHTIRDIEQRIIGATELKHPAFIRGMLRQHLRRVDDDPATDT